KAALAGVNVAGAYLPANTPGTIEHWMANEHYPNDEAFLFAIAEAMRAEYQAIVDAGFLLQLSRPAPRRHSAAGHHRSDLPGARRQLFDRSLEPLPRARMEGVRGRETAGRRHPDPGCGRPLHRLYRASRSGGRAAG